MKLAIKPHTFTFNIHGYRGSVQAVSVPDARAKSIAMWARSKVQKPTPAAYMRYGLDNVGHLTNSQLNLECPAASATKLSELSVEIRVGVKELGLEMTSQKALLSQLTKIANDLK